jgi:hypothetical protein
MYSGPSKSPSVVAVLVPPACRAVPGDLHERFRSPLQYTSDVCPRSLVIISRMRRTADPQSDTAFALYMSFLGGMVQRWAVYEQWGLLRLAIPAAMAMLGDTCDTCTNLDGDHRERASPC